MEPRRTVSMKSPEASTSGAAGLSRETPNVATATTIVAAAAMIIRLRRRALARSGRGPRYHHIIDPDVGQPARGCVSVTIVAPSPMIADALSTGVFILGPEKGMALVERLPEVEAVVVSADNEVLISSGLRTRVELRHPPTPTRP